MQSWEGWENNMSERPTISAIIIARNESAMIANCIETLRWCDEVIVIDNDSHDDTAAIARRMRARVIPANGSFAEVRNQGLKHAKTDWVLYIDADERVMPSLADEVLATIATSTSHTQYGVLRTNVLYGSVARHGGWERDGVIRLFLRNALKTWAGEIHEHAEATGTLAWLQQPLIHFTHRSVIDGLHKTIEWTPIEAQALVASQVPPVTAATLFRKGGMELFRRLIHRQGFKDGMPGVVESITQAINRVLVYMQVWELQQKPSLSEQYASHEREVAEVWKRRQKKS